MKKILYTLLAIVGISAVVSCQDMLESESNNQLYDPTLSEKTDSVFYANGILHTLQQLADQYYFQNELRGDLVKTTKYASTDLRNLANFTADASNKYDSVYLYYQVINNCNYYLKNRKTDLVTGNQYVAMNEYIAVASIRAWTYLQLVRQYGDVPYITEPVMTISEINSQTAITSASSILAAEAANLESLKNTWGADYCRVPDYGYLSKDMEIGGNGSRSKQIRPSKCFVPIYLVLGDLYLENAQYEAAVKTYYDYYNSLSESELEEAASGVKRVSLVKKYGEEDFVLPSDWGTLLPVGTYSSVWSSIFSSSSTPADVITYIPMATSVLQGQTTKVPEAFGYLYYATSGTRISYNYAGSYETSEIQVEPSDEFTEMYSTQPLYYQVLQTSSSQPAEISSINLGDMRLFNLISPGKTPYEDRTFVYKPGLGNFFLYRNSTVFLSIAEALNGAGYPDAAFAVLKNGLDQGLINYIDTAYTHQAFTSASAVTFGQDRYYLSTESAEMLSSGFEGYPFNFLPKAVKDEDGNYTGDNDGMCLFKTDALLGIHAHGAGYVMDGTKVQSTYNYYTVIGEKLEQLGEKFPDIKARIESNTLTKQDTINAMEDLICDEYALETAFEGRRFGDLQRIARHKNERGYNGGGFGDLWLREKLGFKGFNGVWYLPFK